MRPSLRPPWPINTLLLRWHPRAPQSIPRRIATTSAANAAPVDIPKLILSPGSTRHNSLATFLEYAKRTKLPQCSTVYVGTHYEYTTALSLLRLGFSLLRVGRDGDGGIDLIGHWVLAPLREPLRVLIQCKARKQSISPCHIRELEGSFRGTPADWRNKDVLGLLITTMRATKGTLKALGESRVPMGFVMVTKEGLIQQFVWNRAAADQGLEGVGVTIRHTPRAHLADDELLDKEEETSSKASKKLAKFKNAGTKKEIQLTWMGSPIFPDRRTLDADTLKLMRTVFSGSTTAQPTRLCNGKLSTKAKVPSPRGGLVTGRRGRPSSESPTPKPTKNGRPRTRPTLMSPPRKKGRPKGAQNEEPCQLDTKPGPGRPKGSKNKPRSPDSTARPVGRPKGAKNKPKVKVEEVVDGG